jgi:hypothetical protein
MKSKGGDADVFTIHVPQLHKLQQNAPDDQLAHLFG